MFIGYEEDLWALWLLQLLYSATVGSHLHRFMFPRLLEGSVLATESVRRHLVDKGARGRSTGAEELRAAGQLHGGCWWAGAAVGMSGLFSDCCLPFLPPHSHPGPFSPLLDALMNVNIP